jgi:hypothetical protein
MNTRRTRTLHHAVAGATFALALASASPSEAQPAATYVAQADVNTVESQLSSIYTDDEPVRVVDAGAYRIGVFVVGRPKRRAPEPPSSDGAIAVTEGLALPNVTAIVRIVKGSGMFLAGGSLVDPKPIASDDPDLAVIGPGFRSKRILGGENRRVTDGDIVIVPAGVPHGFSAVDEPLVYEVIRIDTAKTLLLK